jgi:hypothetical protein
MEPRPIAPITGTDTNAELNTHAADTAIDQAAHRLPGG